MLSVSPVWPCQMRRKMWGAFNISADIVLCVATYELYFKGADTGVVNASGRETCTVVAMDFKWQLGQVLYRKLY